MNRILLAAALALGITASAGAEPILSTLFADGRTNTWTQADLVAALQLMNRKYHREVAGSHAGRVAWHGRLVSQVVDTNALIRIDTFEDGFRWTNSWTRPRPATPKTVAEQLRAAREARIAAAEALASRSGNIPPAAAAARAEGVSVASGGGETNITVTVGQ